MIVICCEYVVVVAAAAAADADADAATDEVHTSDNARTSVASGLTATATTAFWECANSANSANDTSCTYTTLTPSGVARIWCEEAHETKRTILRATHKNIVKFMQ